MEDTMTYAKMLGLVAGALLAALGAGVGVAQACEVDVDCIERHPSSPPIATPAAACDPITREGCVEIFPPDVDCVPPEWPLPTASVARACETEPCGDVQSAGACDPADASCGGGRATPPRSCPPDNPVCGNLRPCPPNDPGCDD
jgi:hypothetical protein